MGNKTEPSGSHLCHDVLSKQPIWWEFTFVDFANLVRAVHPHMTDGTITGFLIRAKRMGMISVIGSSKVAAKRKPVFKYRYDKLVRWSFKAQGIGSHPGREIMGRQHDKPIDKPIDTAKSLGDLIQKVDENISATDTGLHSSPEPLRKEGYYPQLEHEIKYEIEYDQGSLSDQLINLAIKVNDLENRPVKTLSDYSTNDLIEELKLRVK